MNCKLYFTIFLIYVGSTGVILFFPKTIDNQFTCLWDSWFSHDVATDTITENNEETCESESVSMQNPSEYVSVHRKLISHYMNSYVWIWWFSLGIVFWNFRNLLKFIRSNRSRFSGKEIQI